MSVFGKAGFLLYTSVDLSADIEIRMAGMTRGTTVGGTYDLVLSL
jgi:hypothetical protein